MNYNGFIAGLIIGAIIAFIIAFFIVAIKINNTPQAIDVYRGKTTLKITYVDSIPQDTTVVFK